MKRLLLFSCLIGCCTPLPVGGEQVPHPVPNRLQHPYKPLPPEIQLLVDQLGRVALHDLDRDGWDDLWRLVYSFSRDGRNFAAHLQPEPAGDADGDGVSNFEEMLNFTNPWGADVPVRQMTPAELKAARAAAYKASRKNDAKIVSRFHSLLEDYGAMDRRATTDEETSPTENADEIPDVETSFYFPEQGSLENHPMLVSTAGSPEIIFFERLSNGNCLLAWNGDADKLFDVEWSDDLNTWHVGAISLPTVNGIGTWGQTTLSEKRFVRIVRTNTPSTPSAPDGGDGLTTFGGMISLSPSANFGTVTVNLPGSVEPSSVQLFINGEFHTYCAELSGGSYAFSYDRTKIPAGPNTAYVLIDANFDTTPGPDNPALLSPGFLRTSEVSLNNQFEGITGFRATETEINDGLLGSPTATIFLLDYPSISQPTSNPEDIEYELILQDFDDETVVRTWTGTIPAETPGSIQIPWNGTREDGSSLPPGTYFASFYGPYGDLFRQQGSIHVRQGAMPFKALALYEKLEAQGNWGQEELDAYRPPWADNVNSTSGWGPWGALGGGPAAICGAMQRGLNKTPGSKWKFTFWGPNNKFSDAQPWAGAGTYPGSDFVNGNPFNDYDIGFLIGHGVASEGGVYTDDQNQQVTMPRQHYFPMVVNPSTGQTTWLKSGQMAEKFGEEGKLKWMFVMTCNYLRVAEHNLFGGHDLYDPMKQANTLPFGDGLRVLCSYTTYIHLEGSLGIGLAEGLLQQRQGLTTVLQAWNHAWTVSKENSKTDNDGWGNNARSVYWAECENDTILGVQSVSVPPLQAHASQNDLEHADSRLFP